MKKAKLIGAILGVVLFVLAMAGLTYAWFTWRSENISISGNTKCFNVNYTKGQTLTGENMLLFDESKIINTNSITIKKGMAVTSVDVSIDPSCGFKGEIIFDLTTSELSEAFAENGSSKGALKAVAAYYDPSVYNEMTTSALEGESFLILGKMSITSESTLTFNVELPEMPIGFLLVFYIDGALATNDAEDTTFTTTIAAKVKQIVE